MQLLQLHPDCFADMGSRIEKSRCLKNIGAVLPKRPLTFSYILFYILFLPDSWQILIGVVAAYILAPRTITPEMGLFGRIMLYIMIGTIGYAASRLPARAITRVIKKAILGDRQPS